MIRVLKRSASLVIVIAAIVYVVAVAQRSTMGVASLEATERFDTNAEQLAALAVFQLIMYTAMQVPVGLLIDRFGPRIVITFGSAVMTIGQLIVAFSQTLTVAVLGRMLVGFGDAFIFISLLRLINGWTSGKVASALQQWLGNGGQLGQVFSAFGFAAMLHLTNWQFSFAAMAVAGGAVTLVAWLLIADDKEHVSNTRERVDFRSALRLLNAERKKPTTRMAFWTHFTLLSTSTTLLLLWGVPFLKSGQGLSSPTVSLLLSSFVFVGFATGVGYAHICAHRPQLRHVTVTTMALLTILGVLLVIAWPGKTPIWLLWTLVLLVGAAGPASMIAYDYSKQYVAKTQLGATNGFINMGGFIATFVMMFLIGVVLDLYHWLSIQTQSDAVLYSTEGFRVAFLVIPSVVAFGLWRYRLNRALAQSA